MSSKKKIYISSGFPEETIIYISKILKYYLLNKNYEIIFESEETLNLFQKYFSRFKFNIKCTTKTQVLPLWYKNVFTKVLLLIILELRYVLLFCFLDKKKLLINSKNSWMDYQIYHSYIDKINYSLDENLKLSFIKKLKNILSILDQIYCARKMSNNIEIKYFLISHPVYQYRAFIAKLRNKKKNFLMLGVFGLYKFFNNNSDNDWNFVSNNFFNNISKKKTFKRKSKSYWVQRLKGFSNYRCANVASQNIKKIITGDNYIFLHIFRDSPFRVIDKSRIFIDYFQWFNETMKIIQKSNQKWFIRLHPIHKEWGENQSLIVKKLLKEGGFNRKNIIIDNKLSSNYEIFKKANKIVTYSGTPALEATAFGIKPIIISKTALYSLDNNSAFKPKSLNEYRKLLLSEKKIFNNNKKIQQKAKELIYIQEKILRFDRDIASTETYKNTNNKFKKKNINNLLSNIDKSYVLKNNSNILEKNNTTYSTEFFEYYNDRKLSN